MVIKIKKSKDYAESNITFIGFSHEIYGRPQYILINSDEGHNEKLKFPGLRFRAPSRNQTLEDVAIERFEEQTGLKVVKNLGLRAIMPTRSRHDNQWMFRNVFVGIVDGTKAEKTNDGSKVYVADSGQGVNDNGTAYLLGDARKKVPIEWVVGDNKVVARIATNMINNFDWQALDTKWFRRIPVIRVPPQTSTDYRSLGCGLAIASIMLIYRQSENDPEKIILLRRKGDKYPGYAGGKIETPKSKESANLDPISCCVKEGADEYGFSIQSLSLICCSCTPIEVPKKKEKEYHNSIINYSFVARPTNLLQVREALTNPRGYLEGKMEEYVVETLDEHRDRILSGELRMPDMPLIGSFFYKGLPGDRIPLNQIVDSGII